MMKRTRSSIQTLAGLMGDKDNIERADLPFGIEAQQLDGQRMMVTGNVLPRDLRPTRAVFEQVGFILGKLTGGIFIEATLPEGWSRRETDHPVHTNLLDGGGRMRGAIFFNAAFHDREAYATLLCRYRIRSCDVDGDPESCEIVVWDHAEGRAIHSAGHAPAADSGLLDRLHSDAAEWLASGFPDSRSEIAYW